MKIITLLTLLLLPSLTYSAELERHYLNPWEKPTGFAGATRVGNLVFLAGVTGSGDNFSSAITDAYRQAEKHLQHWQLNFTNVAKETIYTTDIEQLKKHLKVRNRFYSDDKYPAATWVQIDRLYSPEMKIEVDLIAVIPNTDVPKK